MGQLRSGSGVSGSIDQLDSLPVSEVSSLKEAALPWYTDQILPFDVTLAGTNEMGAATAMRILANAAGCRLARQI